MPSVAVSPCQQAFSPKKLPNVYHEITLLQSPFYYESRFPIPIISRLDFTYPPLIYYLQISKIEYRAVFTLKFAKSFQKLKFSN